MRPDDGADERSEPELDSTQAWSPESPGALTYRAVSGLSDIASTDEGTRLPIVSLKDFERGLVEIGLLDSVGLSEVLPALAESEQGLGSEGLAQALVRQGKLTPYQAGALLQGKERGLQIGPYLVLDKLGAGGMGTVLKARHRDGGPEIALKLLLPSASKHPNLVARFRREAEIMDRIKHPNVVSCRAIDSYGGLYYLVMEYVKGRDFQRIIRSDGPMKVRSAIECIIQAARGLLAAHEHGIVHRDIKPANLLLDMQRTVRVLDLGLARIAQGDDSETTTHDASALTQSGMFMGTADFMAPEQSDDSKRADHRADIYSLGCTLHYLLTGRPPYSGETIMQRVIAHHTQPIPSLLLARPDAPPSLDAVFQAMLAKEPENRLRSMAEVIEKLESCRPSRSSPDTLLVIEDGKVVATERVPDPATLYLGTPTVIETNGSRASLQADPLAFDVGEPSSQLRDRAAGAPTMKRPAVIGLAAAAAILVAALIFIFRAAPAPTSRSASNVVASNASAARTSSGAAKSDPIRSNPQAEATISTPAVDDTRKPADGDAPVASASRVPPVDDRTDETSELAVAAAQAGDASHVPPADRATSIGPETVKTEVKGSTAAANADSPPAETRAESARLTGPEKVLGDKGLVKNGQYFLLDEAPAVAMYKDARSKLSQLQMALSKRAAINEYDEAVLTLGMEKQQLQMAANSVKSQIAENRNTLNTGVSGGGIRNRLIAANNMLREQLNQIQRQTTAINQQIGSLKSQAPTDVDREVASRLDKARTAYTATIRELKPLVTPLITRYRELARDISVTDALAQVRHDTNQQLKLGPSDELRAADKLIRDLKVHTALPKSKSTAKKKASSPKGSAKPK